MPSPLDAALDKLFVTPLGEFMAARETLAGELRGAGHKAEAATVKAQHKPTVAAYALNRLARDAATELENLFEASRQLASGKDFKNALERQRDALEAVRAKVDVGHAHDVMTVVRGAMVDEGLAQQVKLGRFSKLPEVQLGFFGAAPQSDGAPMPSKKHATKKSAAAETPLPEIDRTELARARAAREKAKQEAEREKAAQEKRAREKAEQFERELHAAEQEAARLSAVADEAEREAAEARRKAREAGAKVKQIKARRWD